MYFSAAKEQKYYFVAEKVPKIDKSENIKNSQEAFLGIFKVTYLDNKLSFFHLVKKGLYLWDIALQH